MLLVMEIGPPLTIKHVISKHLTGHIITTVFSAGVISLWEQMASGGCRVDWVSIGIGRVTFDLEQLWARTINTPRVTPAVQVAL